MPLTTPIAHADLSALLAALRLAAFELKVCQAELQRLADVEMIPVHVRPDRVATQAVQGQIAVVGGWLAKATEGPAA